MNKQPRAPGYRLWILASLMALSACGDDDAATESDAGLHCSPLVGGASSCYCPTGTQGIRYCRADTEQWGVCMCIEQPPPFMCAEGSLLSCVCPDRTPSQRMCRAANTVDACMCIGHMGIDSGLHDAGEDAADNDAS